mgnify:CR=1 FL=1
MVLDSTFREVARVHRVLSPSACDASGLRVAEFVQTLPAGRYLVGSSVRGAGNCAWANDANKQVAKSPVKTGRNM